MQYDSEELEFQQAAKLLEQRRVYARRPRTLDRLIPRIIARSGVAGQQAGQETESAWKQVAGKQWANCSLAGPIRRGNLEVFVTDSMVHQELVFHQHDLLQQINQLLPQTKISAFRFRVDPARFKR